MTTTTLTTYTMVTLPLTSQVLPYGLHPLQCLTQFSLVLILTFIPTLCTVVSKQSGTFVDNVDHLSAAMTSSHGFTNTGENQSIIKRRAVQSKVTVAAVLEAPYVMMRPDHVLFTGNDRFEGFLVDILRLVAVGAGIDYEICLSTDGRYGDVDPSTGNWDGIIGEVVRGERDMAAGPLVITETRRQVVHFTDPFLSIRSSALISRRHRPFNTNGNNSKTAAAKTSSTSSSGAVETGSRAPYDGMLLLLSTDHKFGVVRDGAARHQLASSDDRLHRAAWARLTGFWPSAVMTTVEEGLDHVRRTPNGHFALVVDSPTAEYVASRRPCDVATTEPFLDRAEYAFAIGRDEEDSTRPDAAEDVPPSSSMSKSALRRAIDRQLVRLRREAVLQALYLKWWRTECSALPSHDDRRGGRSGGVGAVSGPGGARAGRDRVTPVAPTTVSQQYRTRTASSSSSGTRRYFEAGWWSSASSSGSRGLISSSFFVCFFFVVCSAVVSRPSKSG